MIACTQHKHLTMEGKERELSFFWQEFGQGSVNVKTSFMDAEPKPPFDLYLDVLDRLLLSPGLIYTI